MSKINQELLAAITYVADEKKIPRDAVVEILKSAIVKAYTREYPEELIEVNIDIDKKELDVNALYTIVEDNDELNDYCEISVEDAKEYYKAIKSDQKVQIGDTLKKPIDILKLPKKIVEHIMQLFKQAIVSEANIEIYNHWKDRIGEVVYAEVETNNRNGVSVDLLNGEFGYVSYREMIPNEALIPGQKYNFYIKNVKQQSAGWPIILSRADAGLVKYLLKLEIPEIQEGIVEIVKIARIAGFKTKVALISHQPGVDPCGTVIGPHSVRISSVRNQVNNEQIEVFQYDDNLENYIADVCAPAKIVGYKIVSEANEEHQQQIIIVVEHEQMALLLGRKGSNIRLISQILNADVDVKTPEDAKYEDLQYQRVDFISPKQRAFNRVYQSNQYGNSFDFTQFKKPTDVNLKLTKTDVLKTKTEQAVTVTPSKPKTSTVKSILDKIDNFQFNPTANDSSSTSDSQISQKPTTKPENLQKLINNEQQRTSTSEHILDIEKEIEMAKTKKAKKTPKKVNKKKFNKVKIAAPTTSSILEEFKNKDSDQLLEELVMENNYRENEDDNYDLDDDFSSYEEK